MKKTKELHAEYSEAWWHMGINPITGWKVDRNIKDAYAKEKLFGRTIKDWDYGQS